MNSEAVLLLETVNFAAGKHRNQRRMDPEETPYINHPIGMLYIICHHQSIGLDVDVGPYTAYNKLT